MNDHECKSCKYWKFNCESTTEGFDVGECRFKPPADYYWPYDGDRHTFPEAWSHEWCGSYLLESEE